MNTPQERQEKLNILKANKVIKRTNKNILIADVSLVLIVGFFALSIITLF